MVYEFMALCAVGAESVLTNELKLLGFNTSGRLPGRVFFTGGTDELLYSAFKANFFLRTADRIFLILKKAQAEDFEVLYTLAYEQDWHDFFPDDAKITIDKVRIFQSKLSSEHAVQSVTHKAVYEKLAKKLNLVSLPQTGKEFFIRIYIENNTVYLAMDLSGVPLHRRGYRLSGGAAPMRETLAAVLIQLMQWKRKLPLHDAFCGSGTIPIEASWYAHNIPPGINRNFAFEDFVCFSSHAQKENLKDKRLKAIAEIRTDCIVRITGSDIDPNAVKLAQANTERACIIAGRAMSEAGSSRHIGRPQFTQADFSELQAPYDEGTILSNLPYGERLANEKEVIELYKKIAAMPEYFAGWKLGFITNRPEFEKIFNAGNRKEKLKKHRLKGGNLDTCLYIKNQPAVINTKKN